MDGGTTDLSRIPARIHSVTFSGLSDRTRDDFLVRIAKDMLIGSSSSSEVRSFDQLLTRSHRLKQQLMHGVNGCFKAVSITIDSAKETDADDAYTVHVAVRESSPITGSLMTSTSAHNLSSVPTIETAVKLNNVAGRAETVSLSYAVSSNGSKSLGSSESETSSVMGTSSSSSGSGIKGFTLSACKPLIIGRRNHSHDDKEVEEEMRDFVPLSYPLLSATAYDSESRFPASGFQQRERGFFLDYFAHWSPRVTSRVSLTGDRRDVSLLFPDPDISDVTAMPTPGIGRLQVPQRIRDLVSASGPRILRAGIKHVIAYDGRSYWLPGRNNNHAFSYFPSGGVLAEVSSQVWRTLAPHLLSSSSVSSSTNSNAASVFKQEINVQGNARIPGSRILLQACLRAGIILPFDLASSDNSTNNGIGMSDKFFVGGPLGMRAFSNFGVGPSVTSGGSNAGHKFALGSDVYWNAGMHAYVPLPFVKNRSRNSTIAAAVDRCVRMHVFACAAAAAASDNTSSAMSDVSLDVRMRQAIASVCSNVRTSVGAGLVVAAGPVLRIELNYALPLRWDPVNDSPDPGFQFGFGIHYN